MMESETRSGKKKILIVDDHPIVRRGIQMLVDQEPDLAVCGEAEGASEALRVIEQTNPDVAIVDLSLKEGNGLDLLKDIRIRHPGLPVLVLSWRDESFAERALRAGAMAYITKQEEPARVIEGVRRVLDGQVYVSQNLASNLITRFVGQPGESNGVPVRGLSDRELEVFEQLGNGVSSRKIAETLHISIKTVESHRAHIKKKLGLSDATELLKHAVWWVQSQDGG